ncbi:hypothetical protein SFMTTN_0249 [Sulfuriferula multivorans]|uniref:CopL family metal-binding regulatory protein n=1 Tax=Sulfuriferula multivorans TaxID=1559896 RepID=A0A401J9Z3_9PROT|nr:hypothetical protein [Sulfuriferula multivorans]GBL44453.1 hypothetical protein SFMTTN_0249 [Sulfuriferula multivorans]
MKILFKTILVWLLLLCVPIQGFAAAAMMSGDHAMHEMPLQYAASTMEHADCCVSTDSHHDAAGKCSACLDGCLSVAIAPPFMAVSSMPVYGSEVIPFRSRSFRSFVSATPERPPQSSFV